MASPIYDPDPASTVRPAPATGDAPSGVVMADDRYGPGALLTLSLIHI